MIAIANAQWKAPPTDSVFTIVTGVGGGDCGYAFELNREYVIFASSTTVPGEYYTGLCHRTREATAAIADLAALGPAQRTFEWRN